MTDIVNLFKNKGETPLEALNRLKILKPELENTPLTYAGRLDPMAEGVLLVLVGEENKKRVDYLALEKEYEVEILFGVETDTYDVLGIPNTLNLKSNPTPDPSRIREGKVSEILKKSVGTFLQPYPPYSSKPVQGKALFQWAREGKLNEIEIPKKEVTIFSCDLIDIYPLSTSELQKNIYESLSLIKGDFRQEAIKKSWVEFFSPLSLDLQFQIARIKVVCSSGTYMRSLAHTIGMEMGTSAIALSIKRSRVGNFRVEDSLKT